MKAPRSQARNRTCARATPQTWPGVALAGTNGNAYAHYLYQGGVLSPCVAAHQHYSRLLAPRRCRATLFRCARVMCARPPACAPWHVRSRIFIVAPRKSRVVGPRREAGIGVPGSPYRGTASRRPGRGRPPLPPLQKRESFAIAVPGVSYRGWFSRSCPVPAATSAALHVLRGGGRR